MKRIILLIATNLAIMLVLGIVVTLTGANRFFTGTGLDLGKLLVFAAIMGFGGAFMSLWMSKTIAKWSTGARVIESPQQRHGTLAVRHGAPFLGKGRAADARDRHLRRRAECLRDRRHAATIRWWLSPPACCRPCRARKPRR